MTSTRRSSPRWANEEHRSAWEQTFIDWTTCSDKNTIDEYFKKHPNDALAAARSFIASSHAPSKPNVQLDSNSSQRRSSRCEASRDAARREWIEKFKDATLCTDENLIDLSRQLHPNVDDAINHYRNAKKLEEEAAQGRDGNEKKRVYGDMQGTVVNVGQWDNKSELTSHIKRHANSHGLQAQQQNVKFKRNPLVIDNNNDTSSDAFVGEDDNALSFLHDDKGVASASTTVATATTAATTAATTTTAEDDNNEDDEDTVMGDEDDEDEDMGMEEYRGDTADMDSIISTHASSSDEVEVVGNSSAVLLRGVVVCLSGQDCSRKQALQNIITKLGGEFNPELDPRNVTHLVVDEDDYCNSLKLCFLLDRRRNRNVQQHACKQIIICSSVWLDACYDQHSRVDEAPYSPSAIRLSSIMFTPAARLALAAGLEVEEETMAAPMGSMIDHELLGDKESTVGDMENDIKQRSLVDDGEEEEEEVNDEEYLEEDVANEDNNEYLQAGETSNVNNSRHQDRSHKKMTTTAETKKRRLLLDEMMSKYECAPVVESQYNAPTVPRSSVVEARNGTLSVSQALNERALRVQLGKDHMDLSLFQNGRRTVPELYLARHVQRVNANFKREAFIIREQALSPKNCTEVICTSCDMIIKSILPHQNRTNCKFIDYPKEYLTRHVENQCSKLCVTCGVSTRTLAREGHNPKQIEQHLRNCKEYSANLASYTKYVAATGMFEITRPNCRKHQFNRNVLYQFTSRWLGGRDTEKKKKFVLSRQRRTELEVEVPGALEYFSEKNEKEKMKKEEVSASDKKPAAK